MKYTQKSQDFQRMVRVRAVCVLVVMLASNSRAQEIVWPVPSAGTEYLAGIQSNVESYDSYFPPLQSITFFGGPRSSAGLFYGKVSTGWRSGNRGTQAEVEFYPLIAQGSYGYFGYAYGFSAPFPVHRGGLEYFRSFASAFEGSAGMRFYSFRDNNTIVLGTGTLNKYAGNFWFSARPYVSLNLKRPSLSATLTARYYPGSPEEFWFLRMGAGFTPDERSTLSGSGTAGSELFTLHSQSLGLGGQLWLSRALLMNLDAGLTRQEVGFRRGTYVLNASLWCGIRMTL